TDAARAGRLDVRGDDAAFGGGYRALVTGFNATLDALLAPITDAAATLDRIAGGDLTARVPGTYAGDHARLPAAAQATATTLADAIARVADSTATVGLAGSEIAAGSEALAGAASQQAAGLEEVSAGLTELAASTRETAQRAA